MSASPLTPEKPGRAAFDPAAMAADKTPPAPPSLYPSVSSDSGGDPYDAPPGFKRQLLFEIFYMPVNNGLRPIIIALVVVLLVLIFKFERLSWYISYMHYIVLLFCIIIRNLRCIVTSLRTPHHSIPQHMKGKSVRHTFDLGFIVCSFYWPSEREVWATAIFDLASAIFMKTLAPRVAMHKYWWSEGSLHMKYQDGPADAAAAATLFLA